MSVHLDHAATTPLRDEVVEEMAAIHRLGLGNPSSRHAAGRRARRLLDDARDEVADLFGVDASEIVFTSGGTEADDLAVRGVAARRPGTVLCSAVEHDAVLEPTRAAGGRTVAVDARGLVSLDDLADALEAAAGAGGVSLVSVMAVNNENGVRQPVEAVSSLVDRIAPGTPVHTDAVQAAGWMDLRDLAARVDLMTVTGHKLGGPVGTGVLVVRDGTPLSARLLGGGQENERRSWTQNVAGAVGLARALTLAAGERDAVAPRVSALRDRFADAVVATVDAVVEPANPDHGDRGNLVGGTVQLCFPGVESEALLFLLDEAGVEASAGSACAAGALEPSHVLEAMGVDPAVARGALRVSVGRTTTAEEIDRAVQVVVDAVGRLRRVRAA